MYKISYLVGLGLFVCVCVCVFQISQDNLITPRVDRKSVRILCKEVGLLGLGSSLCGDIRFLFAWVRKSHIKGDFYFIL